MARKRGWQHAKSEGNTEAKRRQKAKTKPKPKTPKIKVSDYAHQTDHTELDPLPIEYITRGYEKWEQRYGARARPRPDRNVNIEQLTVLHYCFSAGNIGVDFALWNQYAERSAERVQMCYPRATPEGFRTEWILGPADIDSWLACYYALSS